MRLGLLLSLTLVSSCLGDCSSIGVGKMRGGAMRHGGMVGSMRSPVGGVVGVDWPYDPAIVIEYAKETSFANNDAIGAVTNFGTLTLDITQGTTANKPTYKDPCPVGPAVPCAYHDAGDYMADSGVRATLKFLHDGTGATCAWVYETTTTAQQVIFFTGDTGGGAPGFNGYIFNGQTYANWQNDTGSAVAASGASSTPINQTHAVMSIDLVADTPDFSIFAEDFTTALGTGSLAPRSTNNPLSAFTIGGNWAGGSYLNGYIFAIACWSQRLTTAEREAVQAAMEAYYGGSFPL